MRSEKMADANGIAGCVREGATDEQYAELVERIKTAIRAERRAAFREGLQWTHCHDSFDMGQALEQWERSER
jgi:hypothetical protein